MLTTKLPAKWRDLVAVDKDARERGYIGRIPYILVLRWMTLLGMGLRFSLHWEEYIGHLQAVSISVGTALVLAVVLTIRPLRATGQFYKRKVFFVVLLDILIVSIAYLATSRLQSDFFLFFFLPLILAAEYLPAAWTFSVCGFVAAALYGIIYRLHSVDDVAHMTMREAFLRVYLGREFFFLGFVCTAWYLLRHERIQQQRLQRARNEMRALFKFSLRIDQLFRPEEMLSEALKVAVDTSNATWGVGVSIEDEGVPKVLRYPAAIHPNAKNLERLLELTRSRQELGSGEDGILDSNEWAVERLKIGRRSLGFLAIGVLPDERLHPEARSFLHALTGSLSNGLRRWRFISALRRINRETLRTLEFDRELDSVLRYAIEDLRMEFATITLKDDYRGVVETVRGRNVPPGMLRLSRYSIQTEDIQTWVVGHGETVILDQNNKLFNQDMFERFEHHKLARIWVPIRDGDEVIGTIEAGCIKERRSAVLSDESCKALEKLGIEKGRVLAVLRPQGLLHLIAKEAIQLVGADSASIHVFQSPEQFSEELHPSLSEKEVASHLGTSVPLLVAGAGRADAKFIQAHPPRPNGIGWQVIVEAIRKQSGIYRVVDDEAELKTTNPEIYNAGVRAILAIPLRVAPDIFGVLYVHYWRSHEFAAQEIQVERVFAAQIEVAIQSHLLLRSAAEAIQDSRSLLGWLSVIQSPAILKESLPVLEELAQKLLLVADADNVVLYQYDQNRRVFIAPPILKGKFLDVKAMRTEVDSSHLVYRLLGETLPQFYENLKHERPELFLPSPHGRRFVEREEIHSCAILELRARDELFGLFFVNYRNRQRFTPELRNTMQALAISAASVIRTARFYEWMERRGKQLEALRDVDQAIVDSAKDLNVEAFLGAILTGAIAVSRSPVGAVMRPVPGTEGQELRASASFPDKTAEFRCSGTGVIGECTRTGKLCYSQRMGDSDRPVISSKARSCVAVPLSDPGGNDFFGVLYLEKQEDAFSEEDFAVLRNLATQAVIGLHSIENYLKLDQEQRRAVAVSTIARRIQNADYSIESVLFQILTAITAGESLGFSRAMIFLKAEHEKRLRGFSASGESTTTGASQAWEALGPRPIEKALDQAVEYFDLVSRGEKQSDFLQAIRSIEIPLSDDGGALARCFRSKKIENVEGGHADPFRYFVAEKTGVDYAAISFACVPLLVRNETIGVLVVDQRFKSSIEKERIPDEMVERLTAYAELAAMSVETHTLSKKTQIHTYEDLAHQLRRPIAAASDHCRNLVSYAKMEGWHELPVLEDLEVSIEKAVQVSRNLRHYSSLAAGVPLEFKLERMLPGPVLKLIQEAVHEFKVFDQASVIFDIRETGFLGLEVVHVDADMGLVREALENLLDNAAKYSYKGTTVTIAAELTNNPSGFQLIVENTGLAITPEEIDLIARRGWRGRESAQVTGEGSGIGLWVVKGIMGAHSGRLVAWPTTPDHNTRVGLWFPVREEGD
jgi:GAF domain-containing protein/signal transduction histidine kinase